MTFKQIFDAMTGRAVPVIGLGGENGGILEAGTTSHSGEFKAIQVLDEATFDSTTTGNIEGLAGATVPTGTIIHGLFTSITLASGSVIIYRV